MRVSPEAKARKLLQGMLASELSGALRLSPERIRGLSTDLADRIIGNPQLFEAMGQMPSMVEKQWLTTEEAAKLSGFSRPFITATLDSQTYTGTVNRTAKGHRRILAAEFHQWLAGLAKTESSA